MLTDFCNLVISPDFIQGYVILFVASFFVCMLITKFNPEQFLKRRSASDLVAVQRAHSKPVSRIGGLSFFVGVLLLFPLSELLDLNIGDLVKFTGALLPIFVIGMSEDLGFHMSPLRRVAAICVSGTLMIFFFGQWVDGVGIPGLDALLSISAIGIAFTVFAAAGVANAFNLIDGLNGLSSFVTLSTALALSIVATLANHPDLGMFFVIVFSIVAGFFVVNYPFGKLFLGDGGAYMLGHTLVWPAISLTNFDKNISAFAILLIFFWPVADTLLTIWRRKALGTPHHRPDRLHFHHLVMRFLEIKYFGRSKRGLTNPLATLIIMPLVVFPQFLGVLFTYNHSMAMLSTAFVSVLYIITYLVGIKMAKRRV